MNQQASNDFEKVIEQKATEVFKKLFSFTARKLTDTPVDNLMTVNRKYVNLNGTTSNRPSSSVATLGQQFFDTTIGRPLFYNGTNWIDAAGSIR